MKRTFFAAIVVLLLGQAGHAAMPEPARPGWLGLGFSYHLANESSSHNWLFVERLAPGGPAERAGLKPQDVITAIDGKALKFENDQAAIAFFGSMKPGQVLVVTVTRSSGVRKIRLTAEPMSDAAYALWLQNREIAKRQGQPKP